MLLAVLCTSVAKSALSNFTHTGARFRDAATLTRLSSLWYAEQDDAWAIFTPPADVSGKPNTDGHELDFYTRDESGTDRFWAYTFDSNAQTLTRSTYAAPGASARVDQVFTGIASFHAQTYPLTALQDTASPIYSPMYASATVQNGAVRFFSQSAPWIAGGNQITDVRIANAQQSLEFHLSTQSAPSGYTVVLNYTPAPSPSASPGIMVWPPAIRFAAQGSGTLASLQRAPVTIAESLNALVGGGVARAASACEAEAFNTDAAGNLTTQLRAGSTPPPQWYSGSAQVPPSVDMDGCYNSGAYVVYENSSSVVFRDNNAIATCGGYLAPSQWSPYDASGPVALQAYSAGISTTNYCIVSFTDDKSKVANAYGQVINPCWVVSGSCDYSMTYATAGNTDCDPSTGQVQSGYTGAGRASINPSSAGSWATADGGATYSFVRSTSGIVTVTEYSTYQTWSATYQRPGVYRCSMATHEVDTGSFTIPSV